MMRPSLRTRRERRSPIEVEREEDVVDQEDVVEVDSEVVEAVVDAVVVEEDFKWIMGERFDVKEREICLLWVN